MDGWLNGMEWMDGWDEAGSSSFFLAAAFISRLWCFHFLVLCCCFFSLSQTSYANKLNQLPYLPYLPNQSNDAV